MSNTVNDLLWEQCFETHTEKCDLGNCDCLKWCDHDQHLADECRKDIQNKFNNLKEA